MMTPGVFTLDSVFKFCLRTLGFRLRLRTRAILAQQTSVFYSYIVLLICVNEMIYLPGNLPFFKIHVNRFVAQDDSPGASVISKRMLWVRGLVPL